MKTAMSMLLPGAVLILALAAAPAAAQGVTVALTPNGNQVALGSTFTLDITVTEAGSAFNGFDAVISYDPAALTLIPTSPTSLQQGSLMTSACGNLFHRFRAGASTDTITSVLLCNGVSRTGPGQVYRLTFQASSTAQLTTVRFLAGLQFYNAGLYVNPVSSTDAVVGIGMPVPVGVTPRLAAPRLGLKIAPSPTRLGALFTLESDRTGMQKVGVFDVRGRLVRMFEDSAGAAGVRTLAWDGLDGSGRRVAAGVYLVTFQVAGRSVSNRITVRSNESKSNYNMSKSQPICSVKNKWKFCICLLHSCIHRFNPNTQEFREIIAMCTKPFQFSLDRKGSDPAQERCHEKK